MIEFRIHFHDGEWVVNTHVEGSLVEERTFEGALELVLYMAEFNNIHSHT